MNRGIIGQMRWGVKGKDKRKAHDKRLRVQGKNIKVQGSQFTVTRLWIREAGKPGSGKARGRMTDNRGQRKMKRIKG